MRFIFIAFLLNFALIGGPITKDQLVNLMLDNQDKQTELIGVYHTSSPVQKEREKVIEALNETIKRLLLDWHDQKSVILEIGAGPGYSMPHEQTFNKCLIRTQSNQSIANSLRDQNCEVHQYTMEGISNIVKGIGTLPYVVSLNVLNSLSPWQLDSFLDSLASAQGIGDKFMSIFDLDSGINVFFDDIKKKGKELVGEEVILIPNLLTWYKNHGNWTTSYLAFPLSKHLQFLPYCYKKFPTLTEVHKNKEINNVLVKFITVYNEIFTNYLIAINRTLDWEFEALSQLQDLQGQFAINGVENFPYLEKFEKFCKKREVSIIDAEKIVREKLIAELEKRGYLVESSFEHDFVPDNEAPKDNTTILYKNHLNGLRPVKLWNIDVLKLENLLTNYGLSLPPKNQGSLKGALVWVLKATKI